MTTISYIKKYSDLFGPIEEYVIERKNGEEVIHRDESIFGPGPSRISYNEDGTIHIKEYKVYGKYHRTDGPARIEYRNGNVKEEDYYINGKRYRADGPSILRYNNRGELDTIYYTDGEKLNRLDGPAYISQWNGEVKYYINDKKFEKKKFDKTINITKKFTFIIKRKLRIKHKNNLNTLYENNEHSLYNHLNTLISWYVC